MTCKICGREFGRSGIEAHRRTHPKASDVSAAKALLEAWKSPDGPPPIRHTTNR